MLSDLLSWTAWPVLVRKTKATQAPTNYLSFSILFVFSFAPYWQFIDLLINCSWWSSLLCSSASASFVILSLSLEKSVFLPLPIFPETYVVIILSQQFHICLRNSCPRPCFQTNCLTVSFSVSEITRARRRTNKIPIFLLCLPIFWSVVNFPHHVMQVLTSS